MYTRVFGKFFFEFLLEPINGWQQVVKATDLFGGII